MKLSTQAYKGTRDFYPEEMRLRNYMFSVMRRACESFGYEEYDSPILESLELYTSKTSEEIVNEQTYSFDDRGGRRVVMRPEMTPSVSRMVAAKRQELGYPLRMYSIPNCFRYERPQRGRLREFWQLNADVFGIEGVDADMEIIQLADAVMKKFGATDDMYEIRFSSRLLMNEYITKAGAEDTGAVVRLIDMFDKLERQKFMDELAKLVKNPNLMMDFISGQIIDERLESLAAALNDRGVTARFDPKIARGFDYYTDIVFEVFDKNPENNRSMFGGGRYDGLVANFGVEPVPTVGFGMGDVTLQNFLESWNLVPELKPATDVMVVTIGEVDIQSLATQLREAGVNVATDTSTRKLDKKIKSAEKLGITSVLFVGENELQSGTYELKDLNDGSSEKLNVEQLITTLTR